MVIDLFVTMDLVSIFDNISTFIKNAFKLIKMLIDALASLPSIIADSFSILGRFSTVFPAFIWFLVIFAFGTGIICKIIKWK